MEERFRPLTFHGLVLRSQLVTLLVRGVCYSESQSSASQPRLSYAEMAEDYPRYPDIHDLDLTLLNPRMIVDVTPYMNPSPFTVSPNTHVSQVFNLFRTMGLRHLPVVNAVGEMRGGFPTSSNSLIPWTPVACLPYNLTHCLPGDSRSHT